MAFDYISNGGGTAFGKLKDDTRFEYVFVDPTHPREECYYRHGKECEGWVTIDYNIPLMTEIKIYRLTDNQELEFFFLKEFELSQCQ